MGEVQRLAALYRYDVVGSEPEPQFDAIVALAARVLDAPIATLAFHDSDYLWFKARYGHDLPGLPRAQAFSETVIASGRVEVIRDTLDEARLREDPQVAGGLRVRFHAAAPIFSSDRQPIGTIGVSDTRPRPDLPADRVASLEALARLVESELEIRLLTRSLRDSAERYRELLDLASDWTWETDAEHRIVSDVGRRQAGPVVNRITYGQRRWELPGARVLRGGWRDYIAKLERHEEFRGFEYQVRTEEDGARAFRISGRPRFDAGGRFLGYGGTASDITKRVQAEQALRESETTFRDLFERHPSPMFVYTRRSLRILAVNHAACSTYGYQPKEFLALSIPDLHRPEEREDVARTLRSSKVTAPTSRGMRHLTKDGRRLDVIVDAVSAKFRGKDARLVHVRDITRQRRAEKQLATAEARLRAAQKLEALGQLTGGIAHDFNNLLAVIVACLEDLRDTADASTGETIDTAMSAADRGTALLRQMLAFARRQELAPARSDIGAVVRQIDGILRTSLPREIGLAIDIEPDLWPCIVDPTQIETAALNLVVNARDAIDRQGEIALRVFNREIAAGAAEADSELRAGRWVALQVTDSGRGMPADVRDKVFEPFFTTKAERGGTGLGLSTVYGFVHQSGGFITLRSAPGQGTTFSLHFPAVTDDQP
ncbi:MAG: PAS domain S-box protein [Alphaproteobacteria bacterium]|nr:PAS domain S-box protein [Alphaproteobacteria bacterium]MCW5741416.1 PAS domain S-box protein [Alphaproteobacteria bacterium]